MSESDKVAKKQWTTEEICTLIDAFREHRNLWNPKDVNYKNRIKKKDSYQEIAQLFHIKWMEIERKIKNIISQYQRERRNYKKMKTSGAGQHFTPKWFGYNAMSFMHDRNKPRKGVQIGGEYEVSFLFLLFTYILRSLGIHKNTNNYKLLTSKYIQCFL